MSMSKIDFVFFDAGGGHRSSATALVQVIERQGYPWQVRMVDLQQLLDPVDLVRKLTGIRLQDLYNLMLKNEWTLGSPQMVRVLQAAIQFYHDDEVRLLRRFWRESEPDLVVSLVPHFNRALWESLQRESGGTPYVTILTDLADYPPHFWIEPQEQFYICGTEKAAHQARAMGIPEDLAYQTSGMILSPRFYEPVTADIRTERQRLGLDPVLPTGLVMFGGQGSEAMLEIARRLDESVLHLQLIFLCGSNDKLAAELRRRRSRHPFVVEGFTTEVPYYMHLSDFFIGKPGPGSISEALAMRLPVIVQKNAWTLPQERYNADWIQEREVGLVVNTFSHIALAVAELLRAETFSRFRANTAAIHNRAVFEIPRILQSILERTHSLEPSFA